MRRLYQGVDINPAMSASSKDAKTALQEVAAGPQDEAAGLPCHRHQWQGAPPDLHGRLRISNRPECQRQRRSRAAPPRQAAAATLLQQLNKDTGMSRTPTESSRRCGRATTRTPGHAGRRPAQAGQDQTCRARSRAGRADWSEALHAAYVAIVSKPSVSKSTLLNALVGQKVSITSRKAQTTRHRITGFAHRSARPSSSFVDTPGFQTRHGNALNRSLNKTVLAR